MGVIPSYKSKKSRIVGYEGTYKFEQYEGACEEVDMDCVPKLKVYDLMSDNWARCY
jgi:hypothetical protein